VLAATGLSARLAGHAALPTAAVPAAALEAAKASLIDGLAVMLGASGLGEGCAAFAEIARETGGTGRSVILGFDARCAAPMAAWANGAMAHALDFEDTHDEAIAHPHAAAIAAALAVADARCGVALNELFAAIALAGDVVCRIALGFEVNPDTFGWHTTPLLGLFGAATAAGRLLGLGPEAMIDAWSLALCQMTSLGELKHSPASHIRAVRDAFAAKAGVLGAMLAARGVRGYERPLEGEAGFLAAYARGQFDVVRATAALGDRFLSSEVSFKPWPCCRGTHSYVEAALRLRERAGFDPDAIDEVDVIVSEKNRMLCEPQTAKIRPDTAIGAKFSIPFTAATALVKGRVDLDSFSTRALRDPDVLRLAARFTHRVDSSIGLREATSGSMCLTIAGETASIRIEHALGHPRNPLTADALRQKFEDCAAHALAPLDRARTERIWRLLDCPGSEVTSRALTDLLCSDPAFVSDDMAAETTSTEHLSGAARSLAYREE
jgi:2-methylcitrate dehydratase PrpD